jgi:hypothetical protein
MGHIHEERLDPLASSAPKPAIAYEGLPSELDEQAVLRGYLGMD